jgi:cell division septation protein DedD
MAPATAARMEEANDTEITLGTGKMLGLFFGLVILCAVFFGMGFSMGKNSVKSTPELLPSPTQSAPRSAASNKPASTTSSGNTSQPTPAPQAADTTSGTPGVASPPDQSAGQTSPPPAAGSGYFVQVAAVSKQEDAEALVESLKGHQYQAIISSQPSDKLFHVQVGPFTDIKEAESMRSKLVSDGYNPILKK